MKTSSADPKKNDDLNHVAPNGSHQEHPPLRYNLIHNPPDFADQSQVIEDPAGPTGSLVRGSRVWLGDKDDDLNGIAEYLHEDFRTLYDVFLRGARHTKTNQCLGRLVPETGRYSWLSFEQVIERCRNFGAGLQELEGHKTTGSTGGDGSAVTTDQNSFLGIFAMNSPEYTIAEYGAYFYSMVVVPIYDTLGPTGLVHILNQAEIKSVICDTETRFHTLIAQAEELKFLRNIIMTTHLAESLRVKATNYGFRVYIISEVEALGKESPKPIRPPTPDDLALICYTSGTTGTPKGAMLTHRSIVANVSAVMIQLRPTDGTAPNASDSMISYLPLAHMFERACEAGLLAEGGSVGYYSGNIRNLSSDMAALRPTIMPVVPRVLNRIVDRVYTTVKGNRLKGYLLEKALAAKKRLLQAGIITQNTIWDRVVFKNVRRQLGGRMRLVVSGSAPLSEHVLEFMRCALGCHIVEGYGQTECVCPCTLTFPGDVSVGHVGAPLAGCHVKLVDCPDMNYSATDGQGEICVRGPIVFKGYYKSPHLTREVIDEAGWLHTGDVGMWLPNGTLKIIDRKKNMFKLAQGEYISPEKVETVYTKSEWVSQMYVHGESLRSALVGIAVPELEPLEAWARERGLKGPLRELLKHPMVRGHVLADLQGIGRAAGLTSIEQVKDLYLHADQFTIENGLLTPTLKARRTELAKFFAPQIQEMYHSLE